LPNIEVQKLKVTAATIRPEGPRTDAIPDDRSDCRRRHQQLLLPGAGGGILLGGDDITKQLATSLQITHDQAHDIKVKFGLNKSGLQTKVQAALATQLGTITNEMRRVMKYYQDRGHERRPIQMVMLAGGSASMPGLVEYLSTQLGIPVIIADPWTGLEFKNVQHVSKHEAPAYTTAIGLARLEGAL